MERIDHAQRRTRLGRRHHLAAPAESVERAAADLVGLHSSDPATPYLSARSRVAGFAPADLAHALYEAKTLVRIVGMRKTLFVVPREAVEIIQAACTRAHAAPVRRQLVALLEAQGIADPADAWLRDVQERALESIVRQGNATAREIGADVPEFGLKLRFAEGKSYGGEVGLSTRILFLLAAECRIVRARPLGTWLSGQYRWAPMDLWLGSRQAEPDPAAARTELVRRWLRTHGPGTLDDLRWWTGWGVRLTRAALSDAGAVEVVIEHSDTGYVLADDLDPDPPSEPWAALLPGLDPAVMGWKERGWFLGDHQASLFDRNGNAGPTVWWDGRIVGGWTQRRDGEIAYRILEDVGADAARAIETSAAELEHWLGDVRVTPRFGVPLDKELRG